MGQTLTHGIYLPEEGERNCYDGLAGNWQLLDGAVGTVAEHTSALSGKAPLVHTHTKSDITDFPAYGNAAGTICEGNDSRLSDARTPVAHTHTKSDVTDLLNSNFIPSANNSYDLGSSSYQWNNLYAKNYYYNGTAWGLDKANTWSAENTYTYSIALKQTNLEKGELPASNQTRRYRFTDKNNSDLGWLQHRVGTSGDSYLECLVANKFSNDQLSTQGNEIINSLVLGLHSNGSRYLHVLGDVSPDLPTRVCNLGTSTNKWKSFNGINPGALSLPDFSAEFDVSGQIVPPIGESQISINWGKNTFTPSVNGWLSVRIHKATVIKIYRESRASYCFDSRINSADDICVCSPVVAGAEYTIKIQATQFSSGYDHFRLAPCQGNV